MEKRKMAALKQHQRLHLRTTMFFCLSIFFSFASSDSSSSDFATLLEFKASAAANSDSLSSWFNSSTDPCSSWLGVSCNSRTHRVTKLVLNGLNLTGSIEVLSELTQLRLLSLQRNSLSSPLPDLSSWPNIKHLYLSHNRFSGSFPDGVPLLGRLRRLDLSYNEFSGEVPISELTRLPYLLTLRLEFNLFSGSLRLDDKPWPSMLLDFNVSNNNLTGKIPNEISAFQASSFSGNADLCGKPLPTNCPPSRPSQPAKSASIRNKTSNQNNTNSSRFKMVVGFIILDVAAVLLALVTITWCCCRRKTKNKIQKHDSQHKTYGRDLSEEMVCFEGCNGFIKVDDLLKASAEMLGKGSIGTTYKVVMDGGEVMVVKRVREKLRRMKEVGGVLREIGGLRHPNVVSLRAYYSSKDELLLVYDFLRNGSLQNLIHGNRGPGRTPLDWTTRLRMASGTAAGLVFLHSYSNKSKLIHGNLTTSNILIDDQGHACISDIGLNQLLQLRSSSSSSDSSRNPNDSNKKTSQKSDVYSFGVILLEILTGKMATNESGIGLVKWVQGVVNKEEWKWDMFDFELSRYKEKEAEMTALLQVAMLCVAANPKDRPKMIMVHKMIEDIKETTKSGRTGLPLDDLSSDSSPPERHAHFAASGR